MISKLSIEHKDRLSEAENFKMIAPLMPTCGIYIYMYHQVNAQQPVKFNTWQECNPVGVRLADDYGKLGISLEYHWKRRSG